MEFKADALAESFAALEGQSGVSELRAEINDLKAKLRGNLIEAGRPHLETEQKSAAQEGFAEFLRTGESALEGKSVDNASLGTGGHAVPREIDEVIDRTLVAISPIRRIANVVKIGSSNYRKLISTGGTPSGWVGFEALRPKPRRRPLPRSFRHRVNFTPIPLHRSTCSTMPFSTSKHGLRTKSPPNLRGPRALLS